MKLFLTCLLSTFFNQLISQPIKNLFRIDTTQFSTIDNSLYNQLEVIDNRENETDFGIVSYDKLITPSWFSKSILDRYEGIKIQKPIKNQLEEIFSKQVTTNAKEGKLLLVLNRMYFYNPDVLQVGQNDVAFSFSANLFVFEKGSFSLLAVIDSNLSRRVLPLIQSTNHTLIKKASKIVFNFIECNLHQKPALQTNYSERDIRKWDSVIKSSIKLYNNYELPDGIYNTYNDFKNQISNGIPIVKFNAKGRLRKVVVKYDKKSNGIKIKKRRIYAVVQNGKTFISVKTNALKWQYLKLEREGNDYFVKARKIFNSNLNLFYQNELRNYYLSFFELKRMPIMKFKLEPSSGSFTPVDLSKSDE